MKQQTTTPNAASPAVQDLKNDESGYENMPKWNRDHYTTWINWAKACFDAGKKEKEAENTKLAASNLELLEALKPFANMYGALTELKIKQGGIVFQYNSAEIRVSDLSNAFAVINNQ